MQKASKNSLLNTLLTLGVLLLLAKAVTLVIDLYLPQQDSFVMRENEYVIPYEHIDFHTMLVLPQNSKKTPKKKSDSVININTLILHGLYGNDNDGYAIVSKKASPKKTTIVAICETYENYMLKKIGIDYVVFTHNNKEYILHFKKSKTYKDKRVNIIKEQESENGDAQVVLREDINYYAKNIDHLDHDIAVDEVYEHGKIHGFRIRKIRKGSKIAKIGLKQGDVILKANNIALTSYNDAFRIYQNLSKLKTIDLLIRRGNQEKELIYEIQ